jgi:hypothetical protein
LQWAGQAEFSADEVLGGRDTAGAALERREAETWLRDALENGARPAKDMLMAARDSGISDWALRLARNALHVKRSSIRFMAEVIDCRTVELADSQRAAA